MRDGCGHNRALRSLYHTRHYLRQPEDACLRESAKRCKHNRIECLRDGEDQQSRIRVRAELKNLLQKPPAHLAKRERKMQSSCECEIEKQYQRNAGIGE